MVPGATIVAVHQPSGTTYDAVSQSDGRFTIAGMRVGGPYTITAELGGFVTEERTERDAEPRRHPGHHLQSQGRRPRRNRHGRRRIESGVQFGPHRRRHGRHARGPGDAPDRHRPPHRHHAPHAAVRRQRDVRRPGQPRQQRHRRRLVFQQLVRAGNDHRRHRRPHRRRPHLTGGHRAGAGERGALRRPPGQLHRRRRQHRHPQRHQPVHRVGLPPDAERKLRRHRGVRPDLQSGRLQHLHDRRVVRRTDHQEQDVRLRQLREAERHPAVEHVPGQPRRRTGGRQHHPGVGLGDVGAQLLPPVELRLQHRPLRGDPQGHAGHAVDDQGRLQREQHQQDHVPLQPARLEHPA